MNKTSDLGRELIELFEGYNNNPYRDCAGKLTIGYGHLIKPGESFSGGIDRATADQLMATDLSYAEAAINAAVTVGISQWEFDALVSFTYNLGVENFKSSTLLKMLNNEDIEGAMGQFKIWCHANGVEVEGLLRRRIAESMLFDNGDYQAAEDFFNSK